MAKPSKLIIGDIVLEISPDMTPEQIQAMIQSIGALTNQTTTTQHKKQQKTQKQPVLNPIQIFAEGTWQDKIALFIRNEYQPHLKFTVNDIQEGFQAVFNKIIDKAAITTYLTRLSEKGLIKKEKPVGSKKTFYQMTDKLYKQYPEVEFSKIKSQLQELIL